MMLLIIGVNTSTDDYHRRKWFRQVCIWQTGELHSGMIETDIAHYRSL